MDQETTSSGNQMTPEEAARMQKQQCIFCQIIAGAVASKKVYEDEKCVAILDINPANPGHTIVLPREHHQIMPMMPEEDIEYLFKVVQKVSTAQIRALNADGTNIFIANGSVAGQTAPHTMVHVIPRKANDGLTCFSLPKNQISQEDQQKLQGAIKQRVNARYGIEENQPISADKPAPEQVKTTVEKENQEAEESETKDNSRKRFDLEKISNMFK